MPRPPAQKPFRRRGLHPAAEVAVRPVRAVAAARGFAEMRVLTDWDAVIGEGLARRCAPVRLNRGGTLVIAARGAAALEIQHAMPQIIERINACYGYRAVRRIAIEQRDLPPRPAQRIPKQRPPTPAEAERIARAVAGIDDAGLGAALTRLGTHIMTRERDRSDA